MSTHLDRKEIKKPDLFLENAQKATVAIKKNSTPLIAAVVVIVVFGLSFALYKKITYSREQAAFSQYYEIKKVIIDKIKAADAASMPPKKDPKQVQLPPSENKVHDLSKIAPDEVVKLDAFIKAKKGSTAAYFAAIFLADSAAANTDTLRAIEYLKTAESIAPNKALKAGAQLSLGWAYEVSSQYDQAIATLRNVLDSKEKQFRAEALLSLARSYESKGDKANAIAQYDVLTTEYPNTDLSKQAQSRKDALR